MRIKFAIVMVAAVPATLIAQPQGRADAPAAAQPSAESGHKKNAIPAVLERARAAPYSLKGMRSCAQIGSAIAGLTTALGPDFDSPEDQNPPKRDKKAENVGKAVVQGLIPFRGVIREVSGAASAERDYNAAVDAGIARRGFLRGTAHARRCKV